MSPTSCAVTAEISAGRYPPHPAGPRPRPGDPATEPLDLGAQEVLPLVQPGQLGAADLGRPGLAHRVQDRLALRPTQMLDDHRAVRVLLAASAAQWAPGRPADPVPIAGRPAAGPEQGRAEQFDSSNGSTAWLPGRAPRFRVVGQLGLPQVVQRPADQELPSPTTRVSGARLPAGRSVREACLHAATSADRSPARPPAALRHTGCPGRPCPAGPAPTPAAPAIACAGGDRAPGATGGCRHPDRADRDRLAGREHHRDVTVQVGSPGRHAEPRQLGQ